VKYEYAYIYTYGNRVCGICLCIIGGRDRIEPEVIEKENFYLIYRRKRSGWTGGDQRRVLLFNILEEGTRLNRKWSKKSIVIIFIEVYLA